MEAELPLDNVLRYQSTGVIAPRGVASVTGSLGLAEAGLTSTGPVNMGIRAGALLEDPTGRALWLHLNEPSGSTAFTDSSFLGNDGTCSGDGCPVANGRELTFDGNDSLSVPDDDTLDLDQFTLALAVKPTASHPDRSTVLVAKWDSFNFTGNYLLTLGRVDNKVRLVTPTCGSTDVLAAPSGLPLNRWSHIAASYDGSMKHIYVNGTLVASKAFSGVPCKNNSPVVIGQEATVGVPFVGQLDEVEIYASSLDAGTIQQRYATPLLSIDLRDGTTWGSDAVSCSGAACPSVDGDGANFGQVDHLTVAAPDLSGDAFTFATWINPEPRSHPFAPNAAAAYADAAYGKWTDADYQGIFGYRDAWNGKQIYPSLYVGSNGRLRMIWGDGADTCVVSSTNTGVVTLGRLAASCRQLRRLQPDLLRQR